MDVRLFPSGTGEPWGGLPAQDGGCPGLLPNAPRGTRGLRASVMAACLPAPGLHPRGPALQGDPVAPPTSTRTLWRENLLEGARAGSWAVLGSGLGGLRRLLTGGLLPGRVEAVCSEEGAVRGALGCPGGDGRAGSPSVALPGACGRAVRGTRPEHRAPRVGSGDHPRGAARLRVLGCFLVARFPGWGRSRRSSASGSCPGGDSATAGTSVFKKGHLGTRLPFPAMP